jgi:hypothetical protein
VKFGEIDSHVHTVPASWQEMIKTKGLSDLCVQQNTWNPSSPPRSAAARRVTQGTVTAYDGEDPSCTPHA